MTVSPHNDQGVVERSEISFSANKVRSNSVTTQLGRWKTVDESSSDDEDEILWTGNELDSDEDFILIPHVRPTLKQPASSARYDEITRGVIQGIASLSLSSSFAPSVSNDSSTTVNRETKKPNTRSRAKPKPAKGGSHSMPCTSAAAIPGQQGKPQAHTKGGTHRGKRRGRKERHVAEKATDETSAVHFTFDSNAISNVDSTESRSSSSPPVESGGEVDAKYENAASFITSFLQKSTTALYHVSQGTKLTFLQSLIIELGLMSPHSSLPASLNAATRFLKTHAFLNLRDYLSVRHEGIDKLQQIMFKNRKALVNDLRKNKGRRQLDRTWVKDRGLSVFLVHT